MTHRLAIASSVLLASVTVHASPLTFDFKDPKGVNNVVFKLDAPLESINGTANGISGTVTADPENPAETKGKIVVAAETLRVPNPVMLEHLQGPNWLDAKANPGITFELKSLSDIKKTGDTVTATVNGTFTLKGVSKDLSAPVTASYLPGKLKARGGDKDGDLLVIRTHFKINRSEFGIQPGQNTDKVAEEIDISLAIAGGAPKDK